MAVVASLDFHANVTEAMVEHADLLELYRTYPHVDMRDTGARAFRRLMALAAGRDVPDAAEVRDRLFSPGDEGRRHHFTGFFDHTVAVLQSEAALRRVAREAGVDAHGHGCWYLRRCASARCITTARASTSTPPWRPSPTSSPRPGASPPVRARGPSSSPTPRTTRAAAVRATRRGSCAR